MNKFKIKLLKRKYFPGGELTPIRKSTVNTNLATYDAATDTYFPRYTLPEVTITGHRKARKRPYWVSPKGAGNMTVMPGDPEMIFFAPIAIGAGIAASPAISSMIGSTMSGINTAGDALAATAAGQRLTSGLNFVSKAVGNSKAWPWIDAGLTSAFAAHGIDKVASGDIHNVGDVVETGLDLLPLLRPISKASEIGYGTYNNILDANSVRRVTLPITNNKYLDSFLNGAKPMLLTILKGYGSELDIHNVLLGYKYLDLERTLSNGAQQTLRYYINDPKLKLTIAAYKNLYKSRLNLNTDNVDDIYNYLINNPKLLNPSVNVGTTGLLDIIGISLGYGPKDAILFNLGHYGNSGTLVSRDVLDRMKFYGYDKSVPGIYNILRKNIERGTLGVKPTSVNGSHVGFGYIPPQEFPTGATLFNKND